MEALSILERVERLEKLAGVAGPAICPDPTGEGSAWQGEAARSVPIGWIGCGTTAKNPGTYRAYRGQWIAPDPSIPWGEEYEAILPEEHRCGDEYKDRHQWRKWTHQNGEKMANSVSFPWRRRKSPAEPAPGSDAEHPPEGYRLATFGQIYAKGYLIFWGGKWISGDGNAIADDCNFGRGITTTCIPIANPIPANEGDSRKAESDRVYVPVPSSKWIPGVPPKPYAVEWFFAKLDEGGIVALKALPDGHSYDFKTADETYFAKERIVGWMQNPDSECIAFGHAVSTTSPESELRATVERLTAENAELRETNRLYHMTITDLNDRLRMVREAAR